MNRLFFVVALAVSTTQTALGADIQNGLSPRRRPIRPPQPSGGLVVAEPTGKSIFLLNTSKHIGLSELRKAYVPILMDTRCPFEVVEDKGDKTLAEKVARVRLNPKAAFVVPFVDEGTQDMISYFPERDLCIINVNALTADSADRARVQVRLGKQLWRAVGMMLGAGDAVTGHTVLRRATTLAQLDANQVITPAPEQHNQMVDGLKHFGIDMVRLGSYRQACQEGWAPAPTNDVQKAIWDKVHAIPQNPMKIEFDPKKGR